MMAADQPRVQAVRCMTDREFDEFRAAKVAVLEVEESGAPIPSYPFTAADEADGEWAAPPSHFDSRQSYHFTCGRIAGFAESPEGREWQADMAACRDRADRELHHAEACEAAGVMVARSIA